MKDVLLLGADKRSFQLHKILLEKGIKAKYIDIEELVLKNLVTKDFSIIILPIPTRVDEKGYLMPYNGFRIKDIQDIFPKSLFIYGAIHPKKIDMTAFSSDNILNQEVFTIKNAYLTAKACVDIIIGRNELKEKLCMVNGLGRIGKYLCELLYEVGAKVIAVTSKPLNYADCELLHKCIGYDVIKDNMMNCDYIFNTAPAQKFKNDDLTAYEGKYVELASLPYGFKYNVENIPDSVLMCPSLPGKCYPRAAAYVIYESIEKYLKK